MSISFFVALFLGAIVGVLVKKNKLFLKIVNFSMNLSIYTLLFVMGLEIGKNGFILENLVKIGVESFVFSAVLVLVSVSLTKFLKI